MTTYINSSPMPRHVAGALEHDWRQFTRRRLMWMYGAERADAIEAGSDSRTDDDLAAWRNLGRERQT